MKRAIATLAVALVGVAITAAPASAVGSQSINWKTPDVAQSIGPQSASTPTSLGPIVIPFCKIMPWFCKKK